MKMRRRKGYLKIVRGWIILFIDQILLGIKSYTKNYDKFKKLKATLTVIEESKDCEFNISR